MTARIEIPSHVADEVVDGEAVLLNLKTGIYFGLNASGTRAWGILKRTGDQALLLNEMQHYYGSSSPDMQVDLLSWLADLERDGLILRANEPDATTG
jgi:hypothetical protein